MKRDLLMGMAGLILSLVPAYADGDEALIPKECSIENRLVYEPIDEVSLTFAGSIGTAAGATAIITCGGEEVAAAAIAARDYRGREGTLGIAAIAFDGLVLPKGKSYKLEIPAGAIYLKETPRIKTKDLKIAFEVPGSIAVAGCSVANGAVVESEQSISFYFKTETEPLGQPAMTLYCEGEPVGTFEAYVGWDWDLGQANVNFGREMPFEKGLHYSLVLPAGSLTPRFRTDITNEEARVDFIGGHAAPEPPLTYIWCDLFGNASYDVLGEFRFYYDRPVRIAPGAKAMLFDLEDRLIKEVTPALTKERVQVPVLTEPKELWIVSFDFGGIKLPEGGAYVVIPEGSILAEGGRSATNVKDVIGLKGETGADWLPSGKVSVRVSDRSIIVDGAPIGEMLSVYAADGQKAADRLIDSRRVVLEPLPGGNYLVVIGRNAYKVSM